MTVPEDDKGLMTRSEMIARLVFAMGATAMDLPPEKDPELIDQMSQMVRMIITGSRAIAGQ